MTTSGRSWGFWLVGASWLAMGGVIAISGDCAIAQIAPDSTLGTESSVVTPTNIDGLPTERIDGGAVRGTNLFHSFEEFSVPIGSAAYFNNAADIQNIISRVTGGSISNIDGLIRANASANLFVINPNGIIFGPNAQLSIGGSFFGTTASSLNFADGRQFSATASQAIPLLKVSVPLGLQFGGNAGSVQVQGRGLQVQPVQVPGLQVQPGKILALVGGDVRTEGGLMLAPGGRIELGGLAGAGTVGLRVDGNNLSLSYPEQVQRADVSLTNATKVNVSASGGGSIAINAQNLNIAGKSILQAGIASGLGSISSVSGDIEINAPEAINLTDDSSISNQVQPRSMGNAGNIDIQTGSLAVTNGARLNASTEGQGNAGSVNIFAREGVSFDGVGSNGDSSGAFSRVESREAVGNGGNIDITAGALFIRNGALLVTSTRGQGNAGSVNIHAASTVSFDGVGSNKPFSGAGAISRVDDTGVGKAGDINIQTGSLSVSNGAYLNASTSGRGNAGSVNIHAASTVSFDGSDTAVLSRVGAEAVGNGGGINIQAGSLFVTNGARLGASTFGQGNAGSVTIFAREGVSFDGVGAAYSEVAPRGVGNGGSINITTGSLFVRNGAEISASTEGRGDAGSVNIHAGSTVSFDGVNSNGGETGAFSRVAPRGVGKGGGVNITASSLFVTNGARLATSTLGQGDAGSVNIHAGSTATFDGVNSKGMPSAAFSSVGSAKAVGNGGGVNIQAGSLFVRNGAVLAVNTNGQGNAGSVNIFAREGVSFDGVGSNGSPSTALSEVAAQAVGNGGSVKIATGSLAVTNGAKVNVSSEGLGNAGELIVEAGDLLLNNQGKLRASTAFSSGGNIHLQVRDLILMRRQSLISAEASATGNGGNITINAPFIVAVPEENSDITANAFTGRGGTVNITTQGIFGIQTRPRLTRLSDITATSDAGPQLNGTVEINTLEVEPNQGLVDLSVEPVDVTGLIAQGCPAGVGSAASTFVVTGRGGVPPTPREALASEPALADLGTPIQGQENRASAAPSTNPTSSPVPTQIVEAQGWVINNKGEVVLTATAPTATPHNPWLTPVSCHTPGTSS